MTESKEDVEDISEEIDRFKVSFDCTNEDCKRLHITYDKEDIECDCGVKYKIDVSLDKVEETTDALQSMHEYRNNN